MAAKSARRPRKPLTEDERDGIQLAVQSAFRKLKNLYTKIVPIFEDFGFTPPAAGVIARDLSEKIEGHHPALRFLFEGDGPLRLVSVRLRLGSEGLQGLRHDHQPVEGHRRREL